MKMLQMALGLGLELSALMIGSSLVSPLISDFMGWDPSMVLAFLIILALVGWLTHVVIFFNRKYKDS